MANCRSKETGPKSLIAAMFNLNALKQLMFDQALAGLITEVSWDKVFFSIHNKAELYNENYTKVGESGEKNEVNYKSFEYFRIWIFRKS